MEPKVLVVELGDSHNEILFTQTEALRDRGVPFALFLNERLRGRVHPVVLAGGPVEFARCTGFWAELRAAWRIRTRIRQEGFTHLVVNTASGNAVRMLAPLVPPSIRAVGILHDVRKLTSSGSQRVISRRFRDYLVLADHLVPARPPAGLRVGAFYPIVFPGARDFGASEATAAEAGFRVIVPGNISHARRDYRGLIPLWKNLPVSARRQIRIEILGNVEAGDGPDFLRLLRREGMEDAFVLHRGFVPEELFYARVAAAHAVLPLLHPETPDFESYLRGKISGAFNLAFGFRKLLLMHVAFRGIPDFTTAALFYEPPTLMPVDELLEGHARVAAAYASSGRYDAKAQQARYCRFVLDAARPRA